MQQVTTVKKDRIRYRKRFVHRATSVLLEQLYQANAQRYVKACHVLISHSSKTITNVDLFIMVKIVF